MGKVALEIGATTFQFFTRNPRGGAAKAVDPADMMAYRKLAEENGLGKIVAHAPYTLNPCSPDEKVRNFARLALTEDLAKMEYLPGNYYNFHPGSHVGQGVEAGIVMIADLLNQVLKKDQTTLVLLETMAGKGSEIGGRFEELRDIMDRVELSEKMGVCLDTCHVNDGGYDIVHNLDGVLEEFDRIIGLSRLKALHINDSLNPFGAKKDRHAKIGEGQIGLEPIVGILTHPSLEGLPFILETPNELEGYQEEIRILRREAEKTRNPGLLEG
jgi:deoxyribonuclease-4